MASGYKVPTNLELAVRADTIVIATVDGERAGKDVFDSVVFATPTTLLKGEELPPRIALKGTSYGSTHGFRPHRSDRRQLREPNPDALIGGCVRYFVDPGMHLVLFLTRDEKGELTPYRSSFSRDAEDVDGPDGLWVKAVREYAAISTAPKREWRPRLLARAAALRALGDADSLAIAADMDVERKGRRLPPTD